MARFNFLFIILLIGVPSFAELAARPELKPTKIAVASSAEFELSGLAIANGTTYVVSDESSHHYIYQVRPLTAPEQNKNTTLYTFTLVPAINLKTYAATLTGLSPDQKPKRIDFEAIAVCDGVFYLADERVRQIVEVKQEKEQTRFRVLPINFSSFKDLASGGDNAGFEGVALDCDNDVLFVAKERSPRRIFKIDLKKGTLLSDHDLKGSDRSGQKVIHPFNGGNGLMEISADISDLYYTDGFLYVLERSTYEIAKVDPKTMKVVGRVSYFTTTKHAYQTGEPFGLAEALALTDKEIVLAFDNGGNRLTHQFSKTFGPEGNKGIIITFERPKGF